MPTDERTEGERCSDLLLLLHLIEKHQEASPRYLGITKVDKYVFLSERRMIEDRVKGFDHRFFRWNYGPLAPSLYSDLHLLREAGLIASGDNLALTRRGIGFAHQVRNLLEQNETVTEYVDSVVTQFGRSNTDEVTEFVYDLEIEYPMGRRRIRDIPKGWDLMTKMAPREAGRQFEVSDSWVETIEILLDADFSRELERTLTSSAAVQTRPFEGVR